MPHRSRRLCLAVSAALLSASPALAKASLQDFVAEPNQSFVYQFDKAAGKDDRVQIVHMTSQIFKGTPWKHTLVIVRPAVIKAKGSALLRIGGGRSDEASVPAETLAELTSLAERSGAVVAEVRQVPFQPVFGNLVEDEAISYTLMQYFQTQDPSWPMLQPMVKAVVRAMDAVQGTAKAKWGVTLDAFTISGVSKRGWTTWLTAAVDPRVKAFEPMVFDIVHMQAQLPHQLESWGTYSEELGDYAKKGLPQMLGQPSGQVLLNIIDPYSYLPHLQQPKVIALGTNDNYWPLDASSLYFGELPGPKYLLDVANRGHDDVSTSPVVIEDQIALTLATAGLVTLPKLEATLVAPKAPAQPAHLHVVSPAVPASARLWTAHSATRDFRAATWAATRSLDKSELQAMASASAYDLAVPPPDKGYAATYVELTYDLSGHPFTATTPVAIVHP